jgi:tetratricopeptide (TPR) repeat protein
MSLIARFWRGAGFLILGGALLSGVSAIGAEDPSLSKQLADLGRQALAQGAAPTARTFFQKALLLDPNNRAAARGLEQTRPAGDTVIRVAMQDPAAPAPAQPGANPPPANAPADTQATLEQDEAREVLSRQQLTNDVEQRLQAARERTNSGQPEMALEALRIALSLVRSNSNVPDVDRQKLERRIQAQMITTAQTE